MQLTALVRFGILIALWERYTEAVGAMMRLG